jgi:hypothetical protein
MSSTSLNPPSRFIGLDIHKNFFVAIGVNRDLDQVFGSHKVYWVDFEDWIQRHLTLENSVDIEMTINTWEVHDALVGKVRGKLLYPDGRRER